VPGSAAHDEVLPAVGGEADLARGEVDRLAVVVGACGELPEPLAIGFDLVDVVALLPVPVVVPVSEGE